MNSPLISIDDSLLAEIDAYGVEKGKSRSEAIVSLLIAGLRARDDVQDVRPPGWEVKEIARVARIYYLGMAAMFQAHGWPERDDKMLPCAQHRVTENYGTVERFLAFHQAHSTRVFQQRLQNRSLDATELAAMRDEYEVRYGWTWNRQKSDLMPRSGQWMQRDYMRKIIKEVGSLDKETCVARFVEGLKSGVIRWRRRENFTAEDYADAVWRDGFAKGWISQVLK